MTLQPANQIRSHALAAVLRLGQRPAPSREQPIAASLNGEAETACDSQTPANSTAVVKYMARQCFVDKGTYARSPCSAAARTA